MPGPVNSKMSVGCNNLIKEGVHPATEAADILQVLDIERRKVKVKVESQKKPMDKDQVKILEILDGGSKHVDLIVRESGLTVEKVSSALSMMELAGFIKNYGSGIWGT